LGEEKKFEKKMQYNLGRKRKRKRVEKVTVRHWGSYCIISRREEGIMMIKMVKKLSIVIFVWEICMQIDSASSDIYRYIVREEEEEEKEVESEIEGGFYEINLKNFTWKFVTV